MLKVNKILLYILMTKSRSSKDYIYNINSLHGSISDKRSLFNRTKNV